MNKLSRYLIIFYAILFTSGVSAQQSNSQPEKQRLAAKMEQQSQQAQAEKQLQQARARLEQAAREVAELSGQVGGPAYFFREFHQGQPRAMLGLNIYGVANDGKSSSVKILGVSPGSPADNAGLQAGDELLSIDGESLTGASSGESSKKLLNHMADIEPGKSVTVEYQRDGKKHKAEVKTAAMFPPGPGMGPGMNMMRMQSNGPRGGTIALNAAPFFSGPFARQWGDLELAELSPRLGKYFGTEEGVLVVKAPKDDAMKLEDGDVILNIDGRTPNDPGHALRILRSYATGEKLTMEVMRDKRHRKLEMTVPEGSNVNFMPHGAPGAMTAPAAPSPQVFHLQRQLTAPTGPKPVAPPPPPGDHAAI